MEEPAGDRTIVITFGSMDPDPMERQAPQQSFERYDYSQRGNLHMNQIQEIDSSDEQSQTEQSTDSGEMNLLEGMIKESVKFKIGKKQRQQMLQYLFNQRSEQQAQEVYRGNMIHDLLNQKKGSGNDPFERKASRRLSLETSTVSSKTEMKQKLDKNFMESKPHMHLEKYLQVLRKGGVSKRINMNRKIMDQNLDNLIAYENYRAQFFKPIAYDKNVRTEEDIPVKRPPEKPQLQKSKDFVKLFMMKGAVHCGNPESLKNIENNLTYNKAIAEANPYFNHVLHKEVELLYDNDLMVEIGQSIPEHHQHSIDFRQAISEDLKQDLASTTSKVDSSSVGVLKRSESTGNPSVSEKYVKKLKQFGIEPDDDAVSQVQRIQDIDFKLKDRKLKQTLSTIGPFSISKKHFSRKIQPRPRLDLSSINQFQLEVPELPHGEETSARGKDGARVTLGGIAHQRSNSGGISENQSPDPNIHFPDPFSFHKDVAFGVAHRMSRDRQYSNKLLEFIEGEVTPSQKEYDRHTVSFSSTNSYEKKPPEYKVMSLEPSKQDARKHSMEPKKIRKSLSKKNAQQAKKPVKMTDTYGVDFLIKNKPRRGTVFGQQRPTMPVSSQKTLTIPAATPMPRLTPPPKESPVVTPKDRPATELGKQATLGASSITDKKVDLGKTPNNASEALKNAFALPQFGQNFLPLPTPQMTKVQSTKEFLHGPLQHPDLKTAKGRMMNIKFPMSRNQPKVLTRGSTEEQQASVLGSEKVDVPRRHSILEARKNTTSFQTVHVGALSKLDPSKIPQGSFRMDRVNTYYDSSSTRSPEIYLKHQKNIHGQSSSRRRMSIRKYENTKEVEAMKKFEEVKQGANKQAQKSLHQLKDQIKKIKLIKMKPLFSQKIKELNTCIKQNNIQAFDSSQILKGREAFEGDDEQWRRLQASERAREKQLLKVQNRDNFELDMKKHYVQHYLKKYHFSRKDLISKNFVPPKDLSDKLLSLTPEEMIKAFAKLDEAEDPFAALNEQEEPKEEDELTLGLQKSQTLPTLEKTQETPQSRLEVLKQKNCSPTNFLGQMLYNEEFLKRKQQRLKMIELCDNKPRGRDACKKRMSPRTKSVSPMSSAPKLKEAQSRNIIPAMSRAYQTSSALGKLTNSSSPAIPQLSSTTNTSSNLVSAIDKRMFERSNVKKDFGGKKAPERVQSLLRNQEQVSRIYHKAKKEIDDNFGIRTRILKDIDSEKPASMIQNKKSQMLAQKIEKQENLISDLEMAEDGKHVCTFDHKYQMDLLNQNVTKEYEVLDKQVESQKMALLMGYDSKQHYEIKFNEKVKVWYQNGIKSKDLHSQKQEYYCIRDNHSKKQERRTSRIQYIVD